MLLLCQRLDPLNGMANCPGYHGYERVWEHINHEDLGFFQLYFSKKDTESLRRPLWSWFMVFNICVCRSWEMSQRGNSLWAREESSMQSLSAGCFCCWMCVLVENSKVSGGTDLGIPNIIWIFTHFLHLFIIKVCSVTSVDINVWNGNVELEGFIA